MKAILIWEVVLPGNLLKNGTAIDAGRLYAGDWTRLATAVCFPS